MKSLYTRLEKFCSGVTIALFVVNPLLISVPVAYADEVGQAETSPSEVITEQLSESPLVEEQPVATESPIAEEPTEVETIVDESTPEATPVIEPVVESTPVPSPISADVEDAMWQILPNGKALTREAVNMSDKYVAPQNPNVAVRFTELPDTPGNLTIQEITLTKDQQEQLGALSDIAYDISSNMENGTFKYDLTLPNPAGNKDAMVKYAEDVASLDDAQTVTQKKSIDTGEETITITGLNHFTIFSVSADTTGGAYTAVTNPSIVESAPGQFSDSSTATINAPTGFVFNASSTVTATVSSGVCVSPPGTNKAIKLGTTGGGSSTFLITPSSSSIVVPIRKGSGGVAGCASTITVSGITIRPTAGTPLAAAAALTAPGLPAGVSFNAVDSYEEVVGAISNAVSTLIASPTSVPADGSTASTITATVVDQFGNPISGQSVTLVKTLGAGTPVITTSPAVTNASGVATFDVRSTTNTTNTFAATGSTYSKTVNVTFGDVIAPTVTNLSPADNATAVSPTTNLVLTFSENMSAVAGKNITIKKTSDDSTVETIDATNSKVTVTGNQVTINPDTILSDLTSYYVQIESGAFVDSATNPYAGMSATTAWNFTTADTTAPILQNFTSPTLNGTYGPGSTVTIVATYNEPLAVGSASTVVLSTGVSVALSNVSGNSISGTYTVGVTGSGENTSDVTVFSISSESVTDISANTRTNSSVPSTPNNIADAKDIVIDTTAPSMPVANPLAGDYYAYQTVTLSSTDSVTATPTIYYTTDGSDPVSSGTRVDYSTTPSGFLVSRTLTLRAIAYDAVNNASSPLTATFTIAPIISNVSSSANINPSSERVITWTTDINSTSRVVFGTTSVPSVSVPAGAPNYGYTNSSDKIDTVTGKTTHTVTITGLNSFTTYYYRVVSSEALENVSDVEFSFGTEPTQGSGGSSGDSDSSNTSTTTSSQGRVLGASTKIGSKIASIAQDMYVGTPVVLGVTSGPKIARVYGTSSESSASPSVSPTPSVSPEASPTPSASPEATPTADENTDSAAAWSWWYLVLLVIAGGIAWYFVRNRTASV